MDAAYKLKIVLLGDFAVGKTSLIRRFVFDEFKDTYLTTIGVKVTRKEVNIEDCGRTDLLLWDIAGSDKFNIVSPEYIKGAAGGIIVADVTRKDTVENIASNADIVKRLNPQAMISIALNKTDLSYDSDSVMNITQEIINEYPINWCKPALLTSAKTGINVEKLLVNLATLILKR